MQRKVRFPGYFDSVLNAPSIGDLHNRRLASRVVYERAAVVKLFDILGPRYKYMPNISIFVCKNFLETEVVVTQEL